MRAAQPHAVLLPSSVLISFLLSSVKHIKGTGSATDPCGPSLLSNGCLQPVPTLQPSVSPLLGRELQTQQLIGVSVHMWFPAASFPPADPQLCSEDGAVLWFAPDFLQAHRDGPAAALLVLGSSACPLPGPPQCSAPAPPQHFLHEVT